MSCGYVTPRAHDSLQPRPPTRLPARRGPGLLPRPQGRRTVVVLRRQRRPGIVASPAGTTLHAVTGQIGFAPSGELHQGRHAPMDARPHEPAGPDSQPRHRRVSEDGRDGLADDRQRRPAAPGDGRAPGVARTPDRQRSLLDPMASEPILAAERLGRSQLPVPNPRFYFAARSIRDLRGRWTGRSHLNATRCAPRRRELLARRGAALAWGRPALLGSRRGTGHPAPRRHRVHALPYLPGQPIGRSAPMARGGLRCGVLP